MFYNIFVTFCKKRFGQSAIKPYLCTEPKNNLFYLKIFYL